jgi:hypothetical protein
MSTLQLGAGTPFNLAGRTTVPPAGPQTLGGQLPFIADSSGVNQVQGNQTTDPGLGVMETGGLQAAGAGFSVAALADMNVDGSNDYIIGAPGVTRTGSTISANGATVGQAFLVFGNRSASLPSVQSWLSSTPEQRVGLLGAPGPGLGSALQTSPFTARGAPFNYNFDGVSFITSQSPNSEVGAFVASAGPNWFVIGAPNYTGGGRLYYIQATANFNQASLRSAPIDLDNPQNYPGLTIVTFEDTANPSSGLGTSFADVPNVFADGQDTLAIGEPGASLNGKAGNGGVFLFPLSSIPTTLGGRNIVQVQAESPFTIAGANTGDGAGFSLANAGNVNGRTGPLTAPINDLLIGAPNFNNGAGAAYLVYGGSTLTSALNGFRNVDLSRLEITPITTDLTPPQGAVFVGSAGWHSGFTVSGAGNFNLGVDTLNDFMIGSPGAAGQAGQVNLFYGISQPQATQPVVGATLPGSVQFTVGLIANATNPISLANPSAPLNLTNASPLNAVFTGANAGDRAGTSIAQVSLLGNNTPTPILIGAPGWNGGQGTVYELVGTAGKTFTAATALSNTIARQYTLTFPTTFVSSDAINFGISVSSLAGTVSGDFIAGAPGYTGTLLTTTSTPPTPLVGAGAMVLGALQPANTLPPLGGTTTVPPSGPGIISSSASAPAVLPGLFVPPSLINPLGTNFVPTIASLSTFNYAPLPLSVAVQQYLPPDGFRQRIYAYNHPGKGIFPPLTGRTSSHSKKAFGASGVWTLGSKVFTRGRFHPGKTYQWTHGNLHNGTQGRIVPVQDARQKYTSQGNPLGRVSVSLPRRLGTDTVKP